MSSDRAQLCLAKQYRKWISEVALEDRPGRRALVLLLTANWLCDRLELPSEALLSSGLAGLSGAGSLSDWEASVSPELRESLWDYARTPPEDDKGAAVAAAHHLGNTLDLLLSSEVTGERRKLGSYFTPVAIARRLMERAIGALARGERRIGGVCDPACGGGAFLIEAGVALAEHPEIWKTSDGWLHPPPDSDARRSLVADRLYGVDLSPLAVAVTEVALWIFARDQAVPVGRGDRVLSGDALVDAAAECSETPPCTFSFGHLFPRVASGDGFDWIVGNPPWVAFQGRATQKISASRRAYYRRRFEAFSGYATLHALFVERALELAPRGAVTLLLPSSLSDLSGYRATRARLRRTHEPEQDLEEFGQDAFAGVVQPCFGLVALSRDASSPAITEPIDAPLCLMERRRNGTDVLAAPPEFLRRFDSWPTLPKEAFRELGFQSNTRVVRELLLRSEHPQGQFDLPLLEGKNVREFNESQPRLFMKVDEAVLRETRCRLRSPEVYRQVDFVVRQTAAFTIAAKHHGLPFRNSLIAGYGCEGLGGELLVVLLNSAFYRALHCSRQRDARQATFPQVKLSHLRRLPRPPHRECSDIAELCQLGGEAERAGGVDEEQRERLNLLVFRLFDVTLAEQTHVLRYLEHVAPSAVRQRAART